MRKCCWFVAKCCWCWGVFGTRSVPEVDVLILARFTWSARKKHNPKHNTENLITPACIAMYRRVGGVLKPAYEVVAHTWPALQQYLFFFTTPHRPFAPPLRIAAWHGGANLNIHGSSDAAETARGSFAHAIFFLKRRVSVSKRKTISESLDRGCRNSFDLTHSRVWKKNSILVYTPEFKNHNRLFSRRSGKAKGRFPTGGKTCSQLQARPIRA